MEWNINLCKEYDTEVTTVTQRMKNIGILKSYANIF